MVLLSSMTISSIGLLSLTMKREDRIFHHDLEVTPSLENFIKITFSKKTYMVFFL